MLIETQLSGAFPRSERLVEATRAAVRGKATQADVQETLDRDIVALGQLQDDAQVKRIVDGQLDWQDLFRPFVHIFSGLEVGGITRWFDNNTFYKKPIVTAKVTFKDTGLTQYFHGNLLPTKTVRKAILPGPFTFATLCDNRAYRTGTELMIDLAHALREVVLELGKLGYSSFQFNEPAICAKTVTDSDLRTGKQAFEVCAKGIAGETALHTYFGDASSVINSLLDYPVDSIGIDFYATSAGDLTDIDFSKRINCGCIDGRNSLLESPNDVAKFAATVLEKVAPKGLILTPNCDLDFLPRSVAEKKVRLLESASTLV
jgi:5-methyltetrahydropteroyltriglutamate--homocysteine methyltransferase